MVAGAINHLDLFVVQGLPHSKITPDWVVGSDGAGVVDAVGEGVSGIAPGDHVIINPGISCGICEYCTTGDEPLCLSFRILGEHIPGTLREYLVLPARNVRVVPRNVEFVTASAYPLATLTAWRMVRVKARVKAGDEVLIWGIGGGVAQQCLRICKSLGARVWVTSGNDDKLDKARAIGADVLLNHSRVDVAREVRARTGKRGVDVVFDNVGEATWAGSLGALGRRGRLVTCGGTSGPMVQTDVRRLFWNQWTIMGSTMGSQEEFDAVAEELRQGRLVPTVDSTFSLERGRDAYERLASADHFGKVVIRIAEER